jgi:TetR/AcrR family transcriptional regulator, regulator of cefoperazone and chloramphenicol sensitivity
VVSSQSEYHSSLRAEQARQTRIKVRQAARELFAQKGFAATTIDAIATHAGVSSATVYAAFESKAGIVSAMLEDLEETVDIGGLLQEVFTEPDPRRQLRLFVAAHCILFESGADILRSAMQALQSPEVVAMAERGDANRRGVINNLVRQWRRTGALRPGLTVADAGDRMWLLTTVAGYLTAVDQLGWSPERYQSWLGDLLETELFAERA